MENKSEETCRIFQRLAKHVVFILAVHVCVPEVMWCYLNMTWIDFLILLIYFVNKLNIICLVVVPIILIIGKLWKICTLIKKSFVCVVIVLEGYYLCDILFYLFALPS